MSEWKLTKEDYDDFSVAREGYDGGYGNVNEWIAIVKGDEAILFHAQHCSCYGTWSYSYDYDADKESYELDGGSIEWQGPLSELVRMAENGLDPNMPERKLDENDYDGNYILDLYKSFLLWHRSQKPEG